MKSQIVSEHAYYAEMESGNGWRVTLFKEITDIKFGQLTINGFSDEECKEVLQFACTSYWLDT
jgi:hypothetical protein